MKKYYPKLLESDFVNIFNKINVQEEFSKECIKLIKKLTSDKKKEELSTTEKNEKLRKKKIAITGKKIRQASKTTRKRGMCLSNTASRPSTLSQSSQRQSHNLTQLPNIPNML